MRKQFDKNASGAEISHIFVVPLMLHNIISLSKGFEVE